MSKKRKNRSAAARGPARSAELEQTLRQGFELHQQGRVEQAAELYRRVLAEVPGDGEAMHLLGVSYLHLGRPREAEPLLEGATAYNPKSADFHNNLGNAQRENGHTAAAIESFRRATRLRGNFAQAYCNLGAALGMAGEQKEALAALNSGLALDSTVADAHSNRGIALQALDRLDDAIVAFQLALKLDPHHGQALDNLALALELEDSRRYARRGEILTWYLDAARQQPDGERRDLGYLYRNLVPRWHFPMLNDRPRNEAFERAIGAAVSADSVVLDIGTGSGLLAMLAARAGARHVYACEVVAPLAEQAKENIRRNGFADRITVINKFSTDLVLGEDIGERATVLVTETVDVGLLGEGTLPTVEHARRELLTPEATVIPAQASVYAMLVESSALREQDEVGTVCGLDLSGFNVFASTPMYFQAAVRQHPHRALSDAFHVFDFRFDGEPDVPRTRDIEVPLVEGGRVDALVFWFSLGLHPGISVDTDPRAAGSHWNQAVVLLPEPRERAAGTRLSIRASHDSTHIGFAQLA